MLYLCSDEDGSKHFLVDFEQKTLTAQAERRTAQQEKVDAANADQQRQDIEDSKLIAEKGKDGKEEEEMPDNRDEQWSVIAAISVCFCMSWNVLAVLRRRSLRHRRRHDMTRSAFLPTARCTGYQDVVRPSASVHSPSPAHLHGL